MRILLITETVPYPLDSGGRIKTWHTLQVLARRHEVHLHAFIRDTGAGTGAAERALGAHAASVTLHLLPPGLAREARGLARSVTANQPFTVARHWSPEAARRVADAARATGADVVYADHLSMLPYAEPLGLPIVHDAHNVEYEIVRRYAATADPARRAFAEVEWRRLRAYERAAYERCQVITVVSSRDAEHLRALGVRRPEIHVVPIAFDHQSVCPVPSHGVPDGPPTVLFVGGLHWPPNAQGVAWCVEHVWPQVTRAVPGAQLIIVGRASDGQRRALEATAGVSVVGYVADVGEWFARARAFVIPLLSGGGMRVKMLEAFARGVPVVATPVGAEGIDARERDTWLAAESPGAFAEAVGRVLGDGALAAGMRARGLRLVEADYSVEAVGTKLEAALAGVSQD